MNQSSLHKRFIELSEPLEQTDTGTLPRLQTLDNIHLIAYDFYGTLFLSGVGDIGIDDGSPDAEIFLDALTDSGVVIVNTIAGSEGFNIYNSVVEQEIKRFKNEGIEYPEPDIRNIWKSVLTELKQRKLVKFNDNDEIYRRISVEFEARMNPVWPVPGALETLLHFKEKDKVQGIISNSQFYTPIALEALTGKTLTELGFSEKLLHWSFEERMKKPGMLFYKNFIKKMSAVDKTLNPEDVLYIGNDMLKDIYPARSLGMKTALFAGDKRSLKWRKEDSRCKDIEPDLVITSFSQLKECVQ